MTSMRIDSDASAKLWAKRLRSFIEAVELDGGEVAFDTEGREFGVMKDGKLFTIYGRDATEELGPESEL